MTKAALDEQVTECLGPNFENQWARAKYRIYSPTIELTDIPGEVSSMKIPSRLEVLTKGGTWEQHPIVFKTYGTYERVKNNNYLLIIMLEGGRYSFLRRSFSAEQFYEEAKKRGLTRGTTLEIKEFPKIDD